MGESRAATRSIEAGTSKPCPGCGGTVKFAVKSKVRQVICNVYVDGKWNRVEHWHESCYHDAGQPHGQASEEVRKVLK